MILCLSRRVDPATRAHIEERLGPPVVEDEQNFLFHKPISMADARAIFLAANPPEHAGDASKLNAVSVKNAQEVHVMKDGTTYYKSKRGWQKGAA